MAEELELKLGATSPEILAEIQETFPGDWAEIRMVSRYFDNEAKDFSSRRWTLRQRMENEKSVITLKVGGEVVDGVHRRLEWEVPGTDPVTAAPQLVDLGAPSQLLDFLKSPLVVSCGAEFTRRAKLLEFPSATAELALDVGFLSKEDRKLSFQELELELKTGEKSTVLALGQTLQQQYALTPEPKSKLARALAL